MPHQLPDSLVPGESLLPGEYLVSSDGRFRLYVEERTIQMYGYSTDFGRWSIFNPHPDNPPLARLFLPEKGSIQFIYADGTVQNGPAVNWPSVPNHRFVIQSDRNLVHYAATSTGVVLVQFGYDMYFRSRGDGRSFVVPNGQTCNVTSGTVILDTNPGDGDIVNLSGSPIGVRDGSGYVSVPDQGMVRIAQAGVVAIEIDEYHFDAVQGEGHGTVTLRSGDAVGVSRTADRRFHVEINNAFQLQLRAPFLGPENLHPNGILVHDLRLGKIK